MRGDCVVFHPNLFDAQDYLATVQRQAITVAGLVPTALRLLVQADGASVALQGLAMLFSTGAPMQAEEKRDMLRRLTPCFHERYGTTETLAISILRPRDMALRAGSVGQPHSLAEIDAVAEDGRAVPSGEVGLLRYRGPGLGTPVSPAGEASFRAGGFIPGELARIDPEGFVYLEGRSADLIMRGGSKFYPAEIEAVLAAHPNVSEAAVTARRTAGADDTVVAFIVTRVPVAEGEMLAHCRARLAAHKVPGEIRAVAQIARTSAGKVDRRALGA